MAVTLDQFLNHFYLVTTFIALPFLIINFITYARRNHTFEICTAITNLHIQNASAPPQVRLVLLHDGHLAPHVRHCAAAAARLHRQSAHHGVLLDTLAIGTILHYSFSKNDRISLTYAQHKQRIYSGGWHWWYRWRGIAPIRTCWPSGSVRSTDCWPLLHTVLASIAVSCKHCSLFNTFSPSLCISVCVSKVDTESQPAAHRAHVDVANTARIDPVR